jgi:hypothetical protein
MSEEKFFLQVKSTMEHYAPEVPAAVYAGMRRKLWISQFMRWNASRLNAWYLLLFVSVGTTVAVLSANDSAQGNKAASYNSTIETTKVQAVQATTSSAASTEQASVVLAETASTTQAKASMFSPKNLRPELSTTEAAPTEEVLNTQPTNTSCTSEKTEEAASIQESVTTPTPKTESEAKPVDTKKKKKLHPSVYTNGN